MQVLYVTFCPLRNIFWVNAVVHGRVPGRVKTTFATGHTATTVAMASNLLVYIDR